MEEELKRWTARGRSVPANTKTKRRIAAAEPMTGLEQSPEQVKKTSFPDPGVNEPLELQTALSWINIGSKTDYDYRITA
jgi:hypothetical protein